MEKTFATVVDDVRQLSYEEREELRDVIDRSLVEERRDEILRNGAAAREAHGRNELKAYSNVDDLMAALDG